MTSRRGSAVHNDGIAQDEKRVSCEVLASRGTSGREKVSGTVFAVDDIGRVQTVTSYATPDGSGTPVNQVRNSYNWWGDLARQWQAIGGPVVIASTPSVEYGYTSAPLSGEGSQAVAYDRLGIVSYPNGRTLYYNYASAVDQIMSRVSDIFDEFTGQVAACTYLGADTVASESYPEPQISLDYSANNFAALDQFGRVQDQAWTQTGQTLDGYTYTYDADGNRLTQDNATNSSLDETYTYDSLDRLTSAVRANGQSESWTLDSLGNMLSNNGTSETFDPANEIATINGSTATSAYDAAGNMTTTPQPGNPTSGLTCVYDAWNRLAGVSGNGISETNSYDGLGRLVTTASFYTYPGGFESVTNGNYYDGQRLVEQRQTVEAGPLFTWASRDYQYVYSPLGDGKTPILRDSTSVGTLPGFSGRLYYLSDANSNVTAVVGLSGTTWQVAERYSYDAYGSVTVYDPAWTTVRGTSLANSTVGNTVGFASMVLDSTTGLYYDEARWYSTAVSTFISRDPAMADENLYRYCGNMPTNATDPTGQFFEAIVGEIIKTVLEQTHNSHSSEILDAVSEREAKKSIEKLVIQDIQDHQGEQAKTVLKGHIKLESKSAKAIAGRLGWDNRKTDQAIEAVKTRADAGQLPKITVYRKDDTTLVWRLGVSGGTPGTIDYTANFDKQNKLCSFFWTFHYYIRFAFDYYPGGDLRKPVGHSDPPLVEQCTSDGFWWWTRDR